MSSEVALSLVMSSEAPLPLVMSSEAQRSRDIWPRILRSLICEAGSRPERFFVRPVDLGASAGHGSFAARSLHSGPLRGPPVEMTRGGLRPPVEMTRGGLRPPVEMTRKGLRPPVEMTRKGLRPAVEMTMKDPAPVRFSRALGMTSKTFPKIFRAGHLPERGTHAVEEKRINVGLTRLLAHTHTEHRSLLPRPHGAPFPGSAFGGALFIARQLVLDSPHAK
jgi:hypothetical protein